MSGLHYAEKRKPKAESNINECIKIRGNNPNSPRSTIKKLSNRKALSEVRHLRCHASWAKEILFYQIKRKILVFYLFYFFTSPDSPLSKEIWVYVCVCVYGGGGGGVSV